MEEHTFVEIDISVPKHSFISLLFPPRVQRRTLSAEQGIGMSIAMQPVQSPCPR